MAKPERTDLAATCILDGLRELWAQGSYGALWRRIPRCGAITISEIPPSERPPDSGGRQRGMLLQQRRAMLLCVRDTAAPGARYVHNRSNAKNVTFPAQ